MQIFPIDDTLSTQIWVAMVFLTYDRMTLYSMQKDELILMIHALIQVAGDICYGADHTVSLLMFIMILFRCLIMYIIRCKGHIKTHDVIMCLYLLQSFDQIFQPYQGRLMTYLGFPTMPGMNDVMFMVVIFWYIPTWLGDECMY